MMTPFLGAHALTAQADVQHGGWLTHQLLQIARGGSEWVLWLLIVMLLFVLIVFIERLVFLRRVRTDAETMRREMTEFLRNQDVQGLLDAWENNDSMEARVVRYGLREAARGPDAVLSLCAGAIGTERLRYEKRFSYLATVGSNAPFIGLFGTVIGVILAFDQLQDAAGGGGPSTAVMGVIAEALIATGIGLLVAIPAIIFFNLLKQRVAKTVSHTKLLAQSAAALLRDSP